MKVEQVVPLPLEKEQAEKYAVLAAETQMKESVAKAKCLGGGSFGLAFDLTLTSGGHFVVKLLKTNDMLEKEVHDIRLLKEHCPLPMPEILFSRAADSSIPIDCYGMEKIEGKNALMNAGLLLASKRKRAAFAEEVTDALHAIHEYKSDLFGDTMHPVYTDWVDFYKPFAQAVLDKAEEMHNKGELPKKIIHTMREAWCEFDAIFSEKVEEACLIHGDLNVANIMVGKEFKVTGFIDPLNSMYADREYDLFQFNNMTGKRFFLCDTYRRKYGASKYFEQKLAFYGLWNEVFCFIKSGFFVRLIMNPLVKNMHRKLAEL